MVHKWLPSGLQCLRPAVKFHKIFGVASTVHLEALGVAKMILNQARIVGQLRAFTAQCAKLIHSARVVVEKGPIYVANALGDGLGQSAIPHESAVGFASAVLVAFRGNDLNPCYA